MTEKFRLEQRTGKRGHVDWCKRVLGAGTGSVYGAGQKLFAGAAFPGDQHRYQAGGVKLGLFENAQDFFRLGNDGPEGRFVFKRRQIIAFLEIQQIQKPFPLQRPFDGKGQIFSGHGFDQIVIGAFVQAFHRNSGFVDGRYHDTFGGGCVRLDRLQQRHAINLRHGHIDEGEVKRTTFFHLFGQLDRIFLKADPFETDLR